jgi:hypothetical protein
VDGRLEAFDDGTRRLLWPERRAVPSKQHYWDGLSAVQPNLDDAWYPGRAPGGASDPARAAAHRAADGGWIWRTTQESKLKFVGGHVPRLIGGAIGLSDRGMSLLP